MSVQITINGTTYNLPTQGTSPPWGGDLSDIIQALTDVSNTLLSSTDIPNTSFSIANNQASAANVNGMSFDTGTVRSAFVTYSIYRSTSSAESSECGTLYLTYKSTANTWEIAQSYAGSSGVVFSVTTAGQVQYTSTSLAGTAYSGTIKFSAKTYSQ